jgi:hypothetical protein
MSYPFLEIGAFWINLELVTSVEFVRDPVKPTVITKARVHYCHGQYQDFTDPADIQSIGDWLQNHRLP